MQDTISKLDKIVSEVLNKPCFGFVCGKNALNHPIMSRYFGFTFNPDLSKFTAYTFEKDFKKMQPFIATGDRISAVASSPLDYKTIQLKGTLHSIYDTPDEEMSFPESCNIQQSEIIQRWGIPGEVFTKWSYKQSVAVVMNVEEIYDQTPKTNTGQRIY